jgi:hypothetical protein
MQQPRVIKQLGLMEIIDRAFRIYKGNFWLFFGIVATLHLPLSCFQGILMGGLMRTVEARGEPDIPVLISYLIGLILYLLVFMFVSLIISGVSTRAVSDVYMGEPTGMGKAYKHVLKRFFPFLLTAFLVLVLVCCGFIPAGIAFVMAALFSDARTVALIVGFILCLPGTAAAVWASFACAFAVETFIIEDRRYFAAISRSNFLIKQGIWLEWLALSLLLGIITAVATAPISIIMTIVTAFGKISPSMQMGISSVANGLASAFFMPLQYIAVVLLYYNSRIKKEGFDLEVLAKEMGTTLPAGLAQPAVAPAQFYPQQTFDMTAPPANMPAAQPQSEPGVMQKLPDLPQTPPTDEGQG